MKDATPEDVAEWMTAKVQDVHAVYQAEVVHEIEWTFGSSCVYTNKNGNLAISKDVLKAFKDLSLGSIVWERGDRYWRPILPHEDPSKRQAE